MHHPSFEPVRPSVRSFVCSSVLLFVRSTVRSSVPSFVRSLVCSFVRLFIRSFVRCVLGCLFFSPRCPFTLKGRTLYTRFVRLYLEFAKSVCLWYVNNASGVCSVFFLPFQNSLPFLFMYFFSDNASTVYLMYQFFSNDVTIF